LNERIKAPVVDRQILRNSSSPSFYSRLALFLFWSVLLVMFPNSYNQPVFLSVYLYSNLQIFEKVFRAAASNTPTKILLIFIEESREKTAFVQEGV